ncbi:hypothetical protein [Photobacterium sanguinicancri]|uniref:hypothetical protein n=1 Tax=Photobacterium sanguinicancri TaxID=875932 RepID=UPI0021C42A2A|nr:hypothetical protein [Photobacterium sanguinicancri]
MDFESAFRIILAAAGSTAAIGFIGKLFANTIATGAIKKYDLVNAQTLEEQKQQYQKEIESLKSQLLKLQKEHEVAFSSLYQRREEVITKLYKLMNNFVEVSDKKLRVDNSLDIEPSFRELSYFFDLNRLYFPQSVALDINGVIVTGYGLLKSENEKEYEHLASQLKIQVFNQMEFVFRKMLKSEEHR